MDVFEIDNSAVEEINRVYTWQYDNATNLCAMIDMLKVSYDKSVSSFWDIWKDKVVDIDSADDFGLALWGKILGCERPTLTRAVTGGGTELYDLSTENYRKLLKARVKLLNSNASVPAYLDYVKAIFGNYVCVADGRDMSLAFTLSNSLAGELRHLAEQYHDLVFIYPSGVRDNTPSTSACFGIVETGTVKSPITDKDAFCRLTVHVGTLYEPGAYGSETVPPSSFKWNANVAGESGESDGSDETDPYDDYNYTH